MSESVRGSRGYRGRLAPSPTGGMHLGVARSSLCAWLAARAARGTLLLRIEDLDTPRVVAGSTEQIMDELAWLGLDWDEGPFFQGQRFERYAEATELLRKKDRVFECTCSRKEIAQVSSAPHGELGPRYPGTCRKGPSHPGRTPSLRFRMDPPSPSFEDRVHGHYAEEVSDDFVLRRADGLYAYQLAVVVDDLAMGVTEVVRGDDLLSSTPRQLALYRALTDGDRSLEPSYLHVPLVLGADGRRLSKRHASTSISELRARGVRPERIVGALAASLGLMATPAEISAGELIGSFDSTKVPRAPTIFDERCAFGE